MGKRGPTPMPPHLRLLRGDARPSRAKPTIEPTIPDTIPEPPSWLPEQACAEWRAVAGELHRCGLLSTLDTAAFGAYCCAVARWKSACEALGAMPEAERLLSRGKVNPLVRIAHTAADVLAKLGAPFGLSGPGSRARLTGAVKRAPSKFAGFIGGDEPA